MLLGRAGEVHMVAERTVAAGTPVVVAGEAGVGKTRLLREVSREGSHPPAMGVGLSLLSCATYHPLAQALGEEPSGPPAAVAQLV